MTGRDECGHGSLRRACALCDALAGIDEYACEIDRLRAANTKLVVAIDMIRETLDGGEVQDLRQIINAALAEYHNAQTPSAAQQFGGDLLT